MNRRARCTGISPFIMGEAGHVHAVSSPECRETRNQIIISPEREVPFLKLLAFHTGDRVRNHQLLPHMPDNLVGHDKDRDPETVGKVEGFCGEVVHLLDTGGGEGDCTVIPV